MKYVFGALLTALVILYILTVKYKKNERGLLDKKEHTLHFMYGLAMFVIDRLPKKFVDNNTKVSKEIRELTVRENIEKEKYLYIVKKFSVSLLIIFACLFIGLGVTVTEGSDIKSIISLNRKRDKTVSYNFMAKSEKGKAEQVSVDVEKKKRTKSEIYKQLELDKKKLIKKILGENKSLNKINHNLNMVTSVGNETSVNWSIDDDEIIGYDGVIAEGVPKTGKLVKITATLSLDKVMEDYSFYVKVYPRISDKGIQGSLQEYVNRREITKDKVYLPKNIGGKKYQYFIKEAKYGLWILIIGVALAIAIFILKDRDLHKEVQDRESQMLRDYSEIVSKLLVYFGAGLSIKSAFERITNEYKNLKKKRKDYFRFAYEEMDMAVTKMKSGVSETRAIAEFGDRCGVHCYLKLANIIEQNLRRGSTDMMYALKTEMDNAVMERKNNALKEGSEISTKLLGPMVLMLIIAIAILMVPAFLSINL